jgi:hypothetical protein
MKKKELDLLRNLGKLIKSAEKLGEDIRQLERQRTDALQQINDNYFPRLKTKREELYKIVKKFQRERTLARFGHEDEALSLGKSVAGTSAPLDISADFLFALKEIMDDLGVQRGSSDLPTAKVIDDCRYIVPTECHWCTGGGGR